MDPVDPGEALTVQRLLQLCEAVEQGGQTEADDLRRVLADHMQQLSDSWERFAHYQEAWPDDVPAVLQARSEAVEAQFQAYLRGLEAIQTYFHDQDVSHLAGARSALEAASVALDKALLQFRRAVLSIGSSRFPRVNMLDNLWQHRVAGKVTAQEWDAMCHEEEQFFRRVIDEIDGSTEAATPGIPERRAACRQIADILVNLRTLSPGSPSSDFDTRREALTSAEIELEAALAIYHHHVFFERPTSSRLINQIIQTAYGVRDGRFTADMLAELVVSQQDRMQQTLEALQTARPSADEALLTEEYGKLTPALKAMQASLSALLQAAPESTDLAPLVDAVTTEVAIMQSSFDAIQRYSENLGKGQCPYCQAYNAVNSRTCGSCRRSLPRFEGTEAYQAATSSTFDVGENAVPGDPGGLVMTESMKAVADACEEYQQGTMPREAFLGLLATHEMRVQHAESGLASMHLPVLEENLAPDDLETVQPFMDLGAEILELLTQGLSACQLGLQQMKTASSQDLQEGLRLYLDGCIKLSQLEKVPGAFKAALPQSPAGDAVTL